MLFTWRKSRRQQLRRYDMRPDFALSFHHHSHPPDALDPPHSQSSPLSLLEVQIRPAESEYHALDLLTAAAPNHSCSVSSCGALRLTCVLSLTGRGSNQLDPPHHQPTMSKSWASCSTSHLAMLSALSTGVLKWDGGFCFLLLSCCSEI